MLSHMPKLINGIFACFARCIKWVQEAFPMGGDYSGLVVIYEQCVRTFWHSDRYKDDLRYLKVWLEYVSSFYFLKFCVCLFSFNIMHVSSQLLPIWIDV